MVKKQRNNLTIFRPFFDLQEFFKNRYLSFETSDFDFRDLLEKLFHMVRKYSKEKIEIAGLISNFQLTIIKKFEIIDYLLALQINLRVIRKREEDQWL